VDLVERAFADELADAQRRALMPPHGQKRVRERRLRKLRRDQLRREIAVEKPRIRALK
jgi:hypothetical protein